MTSLGKAQNLIIKRLDAQLDHIHAVSFHAFQNCLIDIIRPCGQPDTADAAGFSVLFGNSQIHFLFSGRNPGKAASEKSDFPIGNTRIFFNRRQM